MGLTINDSAELRSDPRQFVDSLRAEYPDLRIEQLSGSVVMNAAPAPGHEVALVDALEAISEQVEASRWKIFTNVELRFSDHDTIIPDAVLMQRSTLLHSESGTLDSVVMFIEVLSPSTRSRDRNDKRELAAAHGIDLWLVDPVFGDDDRLDFAKSTYHVNRADGPAVTPPPDVVIERY